MERIADVFFFCWKIFFFLLCTAIALMVKVFSSSTKRSLYRIQKFKPKSLIISTKSWIKNESKQRNDLQLRHSEINCFIFSMVHNTKNHFVGKLAILNAKTIFLFDFSALSYFSVMISGVIDIEQIRHIFILNPWCKS